jgi:hypothetical protein
MGLVMQIPLILEATTCNWKYVTRCLIWTAVLAASRARRRSRGQSPASHLGGPGSSPGQVMCGICGGQSCNEAGSLPALRFPSQSFIPPTAPQPSSLSLIIDWYTRPPINNLSTSALGSNPAYQIWETVLHSHLWIDLNQIHKLSKSEMVNGKKNYPCNRLLEPLGLWDVVVPYFLDNRLTYGGQGVSLTSQPPKWSNPSV